MEVNPLPNIKSAKKRAALSQLRRLKNRSQRSELKTLVKKTQLAMEQAKSLLTLTIKKLDQAASKGLIHKNAAARKKSRLMQRLNRLTAVNG